MKKIRKSLLVTFDFTQRGKTGTGLAAGSLISACRHHPQYNTEFVIEHLPISMQLAAQSQPKVDDIAKMINDKLSLANIDRLALACYVWSSRLIEPLIKKCKQMGFRGKVILGGYQIHEDSCRKLYPSADFYIAGYAEAALPEAILDDLAITSRFIKKDIDMATLPSPYLDHTISLSQEQEMIHWETRRGCVFKCNFCAHRDLTHKKVHLLAMDKIKQELDLFKSKNVKKINVLDPIFNLEPNHIEILEYAISINLQALLSFQVRFEKITAEFLRLCSKLNVHLEFGLQTIDKDVAKTIERANNMNKVGKAIKLLQQWQQPFEVSLIYGLPGQTLDSFSASIDYLQTRNVVIIKAFPLMLLEGTKLADEQQQFNIEQEVIDASDIPHVVACDSFTKSEWLQMQSLADKLSAYQAAA